MPNPSSRILSAELERGQTEQRKNDAHDHEPGDHLRLAPSAELEVVMERRHPEQTLASGRFEVADLQDHGERFEHEDAADDRQQQLLLDENRDNAERGTERQRSDVAHENLGGVRVVPEESQ